MRVKSKTRIYAASTNTEENEIEDDAHGRRANSRDENPRFEKGR
jgi:hypothetical protein